MSLKCRLSDEEKIARGSELASTLGEIHDEESNQDMQKQAMKASMTALEAKRDSLRTIVSAGAEYRTVEVREYVELESNTFFRVRQDTGEVYDQRPLTEDERQVPMPLATS